MREESRCTEAWSLMILTHMKDTDPSTPPACTGNTLAAKQTPGAAGTPPSTSHIHNPLTNTNNNTNADADANTDTHWHGRTCPDARMPGLVWPPWLSLAAGSWCSIGGLAGRQAGRQDLISLVEPRDAFTPRSLACCLFINEARGPRSARPLAETALEIRGFFSASRLAFTQALILSMLYLCVLAAFSFDTRLFLSSLVFSSSISPFTIYPLLSFPPFLFPLAFFSPLAPVFLL